MAGITGRGSIDLNLSQSTWKNPSESIRHGYSLRPTSLDKLPEVPSPISPSVRLTRKRAASLSTDTANLPPRIGELALNSAGVEINFNLPSSDFSREQICLCQPDPKIPRPRNAFILYRQHYQAQVVAQHPGLANPEISKIIGEQWRDQPPDVKNDWKILAEEEKQRHQQQYPGYRYQPRRAGKPNGGLSTSLSTDNPSRCSKCSGRYISAPNTPLTPFIPSFGRASRIEPPTPLIPITTAQSSTIERRRDPSQLQTPRMESPRSTLQHQQSYRRPGNSHTHQPLHTQHEQFEDMDVMVTSPDSKRRRFNEVQSQRMYTSSSPTPLSIPPSLSRRTPVSATPYRQAQVPKTGALSRGGPLGPIPPSPMPPQVRHQFPNRSSTFDESLRLPPLQTQGVGTAISSERKLDESLDRSVEAMIMSIPYANKIKLLRKISPPLNLPGAITPTTKLRGAVVAIESADRSLLTEVGDFVEGYLRREPHCVVETWRCSTKIGEQVPSGTNDVEMLDSSGPISSPRNSSNSNSRNAFIDYLSMISEWHKRSHEIEKYVTTTPKPPAPAGQSHASSDRVIPIALMPRGFSLSISDEFAIRIPIKDAYAPVDHWQWMATLWRGIIGPDLTIYTKRVDRDEMDRIGGVEVRPDCKGVIVRILEREKMDERTARRLGFEVMEILRGIETDLEI